MVAKSIHNSAASLFVAFHLAACGGSGNGFSSSDERVERRNSESAAIASVRTVAAMSERAVVSAGANGLARYPWKPQASQNSSTTSTDTSSTDTTTGTGGGSSPSTTGSGSSSVSNERVLPCPESGSIESSLAVTTEFSDDTFEYSYLGEINFNDCNAINGLVSAAGSGSASFAASQSQLAIEGTVEDASCSLALSSVVINTVKTRPVPAGGSATQSQPPSRSQTLSGTVTKECGARTTTCTWENVPLQDTAALMAGCE